MANTMKPKGAGSRAPGATSAKSGAAKSGATRVGGATNTRLAQIRERAGTSAPRTQGRNRYRRRSASAWWQTPWATIGAIVSVLLLITLFIVLAHNASGAGVGDPVPASVLKNVTSVSPQVSKTVNTGNLANPLQNVSPAESILKDASGKPIMLYMGADYCPYCAAERWSLVVALSRFGTFSNLHLMKSSSTDTAPNTNTFTFYGSTYTSAYVDFQTVEMQDRNNQTLQTPSKQQQSLFTRFDAPPYITAANAGAIPFIDIGNQYVEVSAGYLPDAINGLTWQDISSALSDPSKESTLDIVGNANYITAAICNTTGNMPANVCTVAPIPTIQQQLTKGK